MTREFAFRKMEGLGNDFVVLDDRVPGPGGEFPMDAERAKRLCDRRRGIGADQVLWLRKSKSKADVRMEIWNADGSTAEMCGNGIRAVALVLREGEPTRTEFDVETEAGLKHVAIQSATGWVRVDMGVPSVGERPEKIQAAGREFEFMDVNVGNPHAVIFVPSLAEFTDWKVCGAALEKHSRFPARTNVEFVEARESGSRLEVRVWERGAGATLACGTGACAVAVAAVTRGLSKAGKPLRVVLPGGELEIVWNGLGESVWMTGPATEVYRGVYRTF